MGKNKQSTPSRFLKSAVITIFILAAAIAPEHTVASDLPLAASSPLAGFSFDDKPLVLPVQRNFQMAMLTASSELGRSCGKMESYGWRMNQSEQSRVNMIFNSAVDRLRGLGYIVEAQAPTSVSRDITLFTADRPDRHFILMWSAGEIGLVMVLCESSSPIAATASARTSPVDVFPQPQDVMQAALAPVPDKKHQLAASRFSPLGSWYGNYTCAQGYTGATLDITGLRGENFEGTFRFYPTPKNPGVPSGRYTVYGQYDRESNRILINPGKWLERPKDFYNTVMVGNFDPVARTFSAYFQGITGCTSFEAKNSADAYTGMSGKLHKAKKKIKKKKKAPVKKAIETKALEPAPTMATPLPSGTDTAPAGTAAPATTAPAAVAPADVVPAASAPATPAGIQIPAPAAAVVPSSAPASAPATTAPTPIAPAAVPAVTTVPAVAVPAAPAATAPAVAPAPAATTPAVPSATTPAPAAVPAGTSKPSGAAQPDPLSTPIVVAETHRTPPPAMPTAPPTPDPSLSQTPDTSGKSFLGKLLSGSKTKKAAPADVPAAAPVSPPPDTSPPPKPSGAAEPEPLSKPFMVAVVSGQYVTPYIPQAQQPNVITPTVPTVPQIPTADPGRFAPTPNSLPPAIQQVPTPQMAQQPQYAPSEVPQVPYVQTVPPAPTAQQPVYAPSDVQPVPAPQYVPDNGRPY